MNDAHPFLNDFTLPSEFYSQRFLKNQNSEKIAFGGVTLPEGTLYLDYAAATPVHNEVLKAMEPWETRYFGNPAARQHPMGELAEHALSFARTTIAESVGVQYDEVIFTSSATESNNLLLRGMVENPLRSRTKILYVATEHSSLVVTAQALEAQYGKLLGIKSEALSVDSQGQVDLKYAAEKMNKEVLVLCVMEANNETGIIQQELSKLISLAHANGIPVHIDAVQSFARGAFSTAQYDFDTASLSSGKIYGPKGAAALIVRKRRPKIRIEPQLTGGGHEFLMRSSTPNIPAIMGFAKAAKLQVEERDKRGKHLRLMEEAFVKRLKEEWPDATFYGENTQRVPGIIMVCFPGVNAMKLIEETRTLCVSVGSACRTLQATASHVLLEMGVDVDSALASLRVSFGLPNTLEEAEEAASRLACTAKKVRETSAVLA